MKRRVILDIDGCFANWNAAMIEFALKKGQELTFEDALEIVKLPQNPGEARSWDAPCNPRWFSKLVQQAHKTPYFWRDQVPPLDCIAQNRLTVRGLMERVHRGAEVLFLTQRFSLVENVATSSAQWFELHGLWHSAQVLACESLQEKQELLRMMKPDLILEDSPFILRVRQQALKVFAPMYPYNLGYPGISYYPDALLAFEALVRHLEALNTTGQ